MNNLLLEPVRYQVERTAAGVWRRHLSASGAYFAEFRSHAEVLGWPLLHHTRGIDPETGRRRVARGVIAVGRLAVGGVAIGQASFGLIGIGQATGGLLFGCGQLAVGYLALGQLAIAWEMAVGQLALAQVAIGQLGIGERVLAQAGFGSQVWSMERTDPAALAYFQGLWQEVRGWLGWGG
jgi:hypothetical protein